MAKNYIRNADRKKVPTSKLTQHKGAALSEFKGTIAYAKGKGIPVFDRYGNIKRGSVGYSSKEVKKTHIRKPYYTTT